ncbi:MAG: hypothetical protein JWO51_2415 [Rhodospirillales bacterium]|nr:hypothetical protein [Rhodospirillales bacterium]
MKRPAQSPADGSSPRMSRDLGLHPDDLDGL